MPDTPHRLSDDEIDRAKDEPLKCANCGTTLSKRKPSRLAAYKKQYCSLACIGAGRKGRPAENFNMGIRPNERSIAAAAGHKRYFTGRPCPKGHVADRVTSTAKCVDCLRLHQRERITRVPGALDRRREATRRYKQRHPERVAESARKQRTRLKQLGPEHAAKKRAAKAAYNRHRRRTDVQWRLAEAIRSGVCGRLAYPAKMPRKQRIANLGCSIEDLKVHLERMFTSKMSWRNWGAIWQIDHIRPLSRFDLTDPAQVAEGSHFTNLRPLLKTENLKKKAKRELLL